MEQSRNLESASLWRLNRRVRPIVSFEYCYSGILWIDLFLVPALEPFCNETGTELLKCLQALPAETLLNLSTNFTWEAIIDGVYAVESALHQVSLGPSAVNSVPFLLGFMPEEAQSYENFLFSSFLILTSIYPKNTRYNYYTKRYEFHSRPRHCVWSISSRRGVKLWTMESYRWFYCLCVDFSFVLSLLN